MKAGIVRPEELRETHPGVFYASEPLVAANGALIDFLKQQAAGAPLRRARLCAHPAPQADQHDMLIVAHRDSYVGPHRHLGKTESFLVVEGRCQALLFDLQGAVTDVFPLGEASSGRPFFYRMPEEVFHALDIESEFLVFVESARGPFDPSKGENAPWAPAPAEMAEGKRYIARSRQSYDAAAGRTAGA